MRAYDEVPGEKPVAMLFDGWDFVPLDQIRKSVESTENDPPAEPGRLERLEGDRPTDV
jgi:hypothetical protein